MGLALGQILGGVAQGLQSGRAQDLAEKTEADTQDFRGKTLDLEQQKLDENTRLKHLTLANDSINQLFDLMTKTATAYTAAGHTPDETANVMAPLLQHAVDLAPIAGVQPSVLIDKARAIAQMPNAPEGTSDTKNYQFYQAQERAANREPLSFADYQTQIKKAGATSNTITLGGEGAFAKEVGSLAAKDLITRREGALDAVKSLQASDTARDLLDRGAITGTGADWMLQTGKLLSQAGFHMFDEPIKNTEAFAAARVAEVGRLIKMFGSGTGLSDADREFATKAAAGDITMNEASIRRILEINSTASRNVLRAYNADAKTVDKNIVPFDLTVPEPPMPQAPITTKTINGKTYYQQGDKWFDQPPAQGAQ
jgi:hypothetical protein